ncbi:hypothetical protein [Lonepinella sp. BR2271]|uniref:hypothetical protein n=1 Tax=Lonepinella sp. BR2271 TaxID=3434550 RepID=UPI003F6DFA0E
MSQNFNLQQFIAQIPKLANETDLEQVFNVMNVVANMPLSIDLKKHLLSQMETKLKDNPNFQKIAETHQLQLKQLQQILAGNNVQVTAEKKEENKKQKQKNQASQQFNLQQLNILKGFELVQYVINTIETQAQWDQVSVPKKIEIVKEFFDPNNIKKITTTEKGTNQAGLIAIQGLKDDSQEVINQTVESFQNVPSEIQTKIINQIDGSNKDFIRSYKKFFGREPRPEEIETYKTCLKFIAKHKENIEKELGIEIQFDKKGLFLPKPNTEENRIKFKASLDNLSQKEPDPILKNALENASSGLMMESIRDTIKKNHISPKLFGLGVFKHSTVNEAFTKLKDQMGEIAKVYEKFNSHSKWDIVNFVKLSHKSHIVKLMQAQVSLYLSGANKNVVNNPLL